MKPYCLISGGDAQQHDASRNDKDDGFAEFDWYFPVSFAGKAYTFYVEATLWRDGGSTVAYNKDISTDGGSTMVGADADLYMGVVTNNFIKPSIAVRAIPDSTFIHLGGNLAGGRMVEIARFCANFQILHRKNRTF